MEVFVLKSSAIWKRIDSLAGRINYRVSTARIVERLVPDEQPVGYVDPFFEVVVIGLGPGGSAIERPCPVRRACRVLRVLSRKKAVGRAAKDRDGNGQVEADDQA